MNLQDLMTKLKSIDENAPPVAPVHTDGAAAGDSIEAECGMPIAIGNSPKQQDNVTMNVSMNGSGAGGIADLMKILRNIEQSDNLDPHQHDVSKMFAQPGHAEPLIGQEEEMAETIDDDEESWGNSVSGASGHHTHGVEAVTFSGDDMNSKGKSSPLQRAPGTNTLREPTNVSEELVSRLTQMYQAIKEDRTDEGVVDVANTVGQGVGSVVGTAKDAWNAAKQGYNQTSTGSSTPANNIPAPMTPKGSLGLPPGGGAKTPAPAVRPNTPNASSIPQPSMQPDSNSMTTPAPGQTADSLGPNVDEGDDQWSGQAMPGGYQDQAEKQLGKFMGDQDKLDFIDQLKNSPEMLARMGLAIVGSPFGRIADNLGFGPGAAKAKADAKADANAKQDVNPMEESADLTAMLKIAGLR
jgi:hypothetical protein